MKKYELCSVTDCQAVYSDGKAVILSGKNPWIFRKDGAFVAKHKIIRNTYQMVFLPENTVLMNGAVDRAYHYISLETGDILWSCPQKGRRDLGPHQFAVSSDREMIYFVYQNKSDALEVDCLIPKKQMCTTYTIPLGLRATMHCYCDDNGYLCMLQYFQKIDSVENEARRSTCYTGILCWSPNNPKTTWKHLFETEPGNRFCPCVCNDEYLLYDSLMVKSFLTGETFDLIENSRPIKRGAGRLSVLAYDADQKLLTVRFTNSWSTIIIDCSVRRIVAHYARASRELGSGCLINNEFWVGTCEGVIKRPFPHMDPFPQKL